jgi:hypothetical protein
MREEKKENKELRRESYTLNRAARSGSGEIVEG